MTPFILLLVLVVGGLAGAVGYVVGRGAAGQAAMDAATMEQVRRDNLALRALFARVKDLAWDHRELDPALSTIVIDEIRTYERRELGE
jgi:uncharacterized membrane protein